MPELSALDQLGQEEGEDAGQVDGSAQGEAGRVPMAIHGGVPQVVPKEEIQLHRQRIIKLARRRRAGRGGIE